MGSPKRFWTICFLFFIFFHSPIFAEPLKDKLAPLIQREWQKIQKPPSPSGPPFWDYRFSPGLPCAWPVKEPGMICYYAFAYAFDPQIADGERVAAPWGKIIVDPSAKKEPAVEFLLKEVKEIGIQGVRPLQAEERKIFENAGRVEEALVQWVLQKGETPKSSLKDLKDFYCLWNRNNGVVGQDIGKFHPGFIEWLECHALPK